jgi:hypothetical protein
MARSRKKDSPVETKPRTEIGGTRLMGEKILNQQQPNFANYDQITLLSTISLFSLLVFFLTISGNLNIIHLF